LLTLSIDDEAALLLRPLLWRQRLTISTALFAQSGALAAAVGHFVLAAMLVLISSAMWTWSYGSYQGFSRQKTWRMLLVQALAIVFTEAFLLYPERDVLVVSVFHPAATHIMALRASKSAASRGASWRRIRTQK